MAITAINVTMSIKNPVILCGGKKKIEVTLTVTGTAGGNGGSFDAMIYDEDTSPDDLLKKESTIAVLPGNFKKTLVYTLDCDADCYVRGPDGNSGEKNPTIYAKVDAGNGITDTTKGQEVECVVKSSITLKPRGGSGETPFLAIRYPEGTVNKKKELKIRYPGKTPATQYFPNDVNRIASIAIGKPRLQFGAGTEIVWSLPPDLVEQLKPERWALLKFNPETSEWDKLDAYELSDNALRFAPETGGLYGIGYAVRKRTGRARRSKRVESSRESSDRV
jgi:hypothetical protein